jgi:hypothetical protein
VQQRCEAGKGRLNERRLDGGDRKKRKKEEKMTEMTVVTPRF